MALATYSDLKAAVASWLMRDDLAANIPDFITLCESRCNKRLRIRNMITSTTLPQTSGQVTLPSDYLEADRIVVNTDPVTVLFTSSADAAKQDYNYSGYPYRFYIQGSTMTIVPTSTADVVLDYYQKIPALSDSNTANWLLTNWPDIYLYGSLIEAEPFLEDDQRLATWLALYQSAIESLEKLDYRARHGKGKARIRGVCP